ncbi:MAG TPA: TetR/AcrR family transcriptional regulator [Streptosporangiaceae bacterium]|nr:TetR/AcrR family transcriptional regulator [Streptosporangiaceae bacterium]
MTEVQDRREVILSTAAEMVARKGLRATTVRGIADAVGVLSGSLYHHFPSKDAIVDEVLTRYLDAIRARYAVVLASGKDPADCLHDLVVTSLEIAEEQPHATAIYQNEAQYLREMPAFSNIQSAAAEIQQAWLQVIAAGVADGSFRDDIPPRVFYRLIRDAVWLSVRWHRPDGPYSTGQLAEDVTSLFLHGFAATDRAPKKASGSVKIKAKKG